VGQETRKRVVELRCPVTVPREIGSLSRMNDDRTGQTVCEAGTGECHYQVRLEGKWWDVPPTAVVQSGNRVGPALAWPVYYGDHDKITVLIRCFLPGAGI
jgi:hypothetical protein